MSNGNNTPYGLEAKFFLGGSPSDIQYSTYRIASGYNSNIFTNDPVIRLADGTIGVYDPTAPTTPLLGVFQGCQYTDTNGEFKFSKNWPAGILTQGGQDVEALIYDSPNIIYQAQISSSGAATLAAPSLIRTDLNSNIGLAVAIVSGVTPSAPAWSISGTGMPNLANNPGVGSTATGLSGFYLDYSTKANTATLNCTLYDIGREQGNDFGNIFNNALVLINNHAYKAGTSGI